MNSLGLRVQVNQYLTGAKTAVRDGNVITVSPAMFDLMKHASPDELKHLLANIPCVNLTPPQPSPEEVADDIVRTMKAVFGLEGYMELCEKMR